MMKKKKLKLVFNNSNYSKLIFFSKRYLEVTPPLAFDLKVARSIVFPPLRCEVDMAIGYEGGPGSLLTIFDI